MRQRIAAAAVCLFAASAVLASLAPPAGAQAPAAGEAGSLDAAALGRLAEALRRDVATAASAPPGGAAAAAIRSALASLGTLEAASSGSGGEAGAATAALAALAGDGIDRERLSARAVEVLVASIDPAATGPEDLVAAFSELDGLTNAILDPGARASALVSIGRMHRRLGHVDRAVRYGQLAERASRAVEAGSPRDDLLVAVLDLVAAGDVERTLGLAFTTLAGFTDGGRRAAALAQAAAGVDAAGDGLGHRAFRAIAAGDAGEIRRLAAEAAAAASDDVAGILAAALPDPAAQEAALFSLARGQIGEQRALAALDTASVVAGPARARLEAEVAVALAQAGYVTMARAIVERLAAAPAADREVARLAAVALATARRPVDRPSPAAGPLARLPAEGVDPQDRHRAGIAVDASRTDLAAGLAAIRSLRDDRVKIAAFRAVAEREAAALAGGMIEPGARHASGAGLPAGERADLFAANGLRLVAGDAVRDTTPDFLSPLPDLFVTAADVRARVPLSRPGVSELSLAGLNRFTQLNRFNAQFLEDVVGSTTREHIYRTQGTINPTFVYLTEGIFTARDLLHAIDSSRGNQLVREDGVYTLRVPLVIGQDATLVLTGQDGPEVRLSATAGAFIVNAGRLWVVDTDLVGWDEETGAPARAGYDDRHRFRPFVTTWSGSETYIAGAVVDGLGYSAGKSYGLTFSSGPNDGRGTADSLPRPTGLLVDSLFRNLYYGFYTYEADDIAVVGSVYEDSVVYGLDPHDRSRRLAMAFNTLYGTQKKHGAIFSRDVTGSLLVGNVSFDNAGSGIMMDRRSTANLILANTTIGNAQDGMTLYESPCLLVAANRIEGNRRSGVKIRNSWSVLLDDNRIEGNEGPAIEGYVTDLAETVDGAARDLVHDPYLPVTAFSATRNLVRANGAGIATRNVSAVALSGNRFEAQGLRFLDGGLKRFRLDILRSAGEGRAATVMPREIAEPSAEDARAAGTETCPPPGRVPAAGAS